MVVVVATEVMVVSWALPVAAAATAGLVAQEEDEVVNDNRV